MYNKRMLNLTSVYFLRSPLDTRTDKKLKSFIEDKSIEKESDKSANILCRQCHHLITCQEESIEVLGSHLHTFANPGGIIYQIGCFGSAKGCSYSGPATLEWTWFKGYSWKIAVCGACLTHLGWIYFSPANGSFHGFILNRLIQIF
jgi:hypothetical protein